MCGMGFWVFFFFNEQGGLSIVMKLVLEHCDNKSH